jgi:hypothetical protein
MKPKFVFDIDGVLRNLNGLLMSKYKLPIPRTWGAWDVVGYDIYDIVAKDYSVLYNAKPTKYLDIIKKYDNSNKLEIWSHQPNDWILHTVKWLRINIPNRHLDIKWYTPKEKYENLMKNENIILVDDYPKFPNYDRILLIEQSYNKEVDAFMRIKTIDELQNILEGKIPFQLEKVTL